MAWKIGYKDTQSGDAVKTTYYFDEVATKESIIEFLGLNRPDVLWYEVSLVPNQDALTQKG